MSESTYQWNDLHQLESGRLQAYDVAEVRTGNYSSKMEVTTFPGTSAQRETCSQGRLNSEGLDIMRGVKGVQ